VRQWRKLPSMAPRSPVTTGPLAVLRETGDSGDRDAVWGEIAGCVEVAKTWAPGPSWKVEQRHVCSMAFRDPGAFAEGNVAEAVTGFRGPAQSRYAHFQGIGR